MKKKQKQLQPIEPIVYGSPLPPDREKAFEIDWFSAGLVTVFLGGLLARFFHIFG